ncbi:unnamed protein product [Symbiodinium necroappetens]|uniref:Uncharacterized protein n=1 Tax=Symbiodinium necroappetens TaxID=1628268 RepID=A0A812WNE4_9DINO|nr:unnamed protein product [Symbiodinium necroappetens]
MFFYWVPAYRKYFGCQRYMESGDDLFARVQRATAGSEEMMKPPAIAFFGHRRQQWFESPDTDDPHWRPRDVTYTELTSDQLADEDLFSRFEEEEEVKPRQNPLRNPQTPAPGVACPSTPNLTPLPQACPSTPTQALGQANPSTPNLPPMEACPSTPTQALGQPRPLEACPSTPSQAPGQRSLGATDCAIGFGLTPFHPPPAPAPQAPSQPSRPYPQAQSLAQPSQAIHMPTLAPQAQSQPEAYPSTHPSHGPGQPSPYMQALPFGGVQAVTGPTQAPCPQPGTPTRQLPPPKHLRKAAGQGPDMC